MKVLILGLGWYGCHAAVTLKRLNIPFKLLDITNDFFTGSSSKNQNRLHQSFHYSRSASTRKECQIGFTRFMTTYPQFTQQIPNNTYAIDKKSIIDFDTYKAIYSYEQVPFTSLETPNLPFDINKDMFEGFIKVEERYIDFRKAKQYFTENLSQHLLMYDPSKLDRLNTSYDNIKYNYIIDCTFTPVPNTVKEQCISFLYKYTGPTTPLFALTVMDGPFWSLYPYDIENNIFTLTDVVYTPLGVETNRYDLETKIKNYIPDFNKLFTYQGNFTSNKIKPDNTNTDDRSLIYQLENNIFTFRGGKLTGMFTMEDILMQHFQ